VRAPAYLGRGEVAERGDAEVYAAILGVLGTEALLGRHFARRFYITLDHSRHI
jgi:hypothetical protein